MQNHQIKNIISQLLNDEKVLKMSLDNIEKYTEDSEQRLYLLKKWNDSNFKDYSIYHDEKYQWECVNCFLAISKSSVNKIARFFKNSNIENWENLSFFDDYNGNGLTTIYLQEKYGIKNISFYNNVDFQVDSINNICEKYNFKKPKRDFTRKNKYDVYIGLESVEHFKNPFDYLDEVMQMINKNGYLIMTFNGLSWTPDICPGHFWEYENKNGDLVSGKVVRKQLYKHLKENGFELIKRACWNQNPQIFKKIG